MRAAHAAAMTATVTRRRSQCGMPAGRFRAWEPDGAGETGAPQELQNFWEGNRSGAPHFPQNRLTMIVRGNSHER